MTGKHDGFLYREYTFLLIGIIISSYCIEIYQSYTTEEGRHGKFLDRGVHNFAQGPQARGQNCGARGQEIFMPA